MIQLPKIAFGASGIANMYREVSLDDANTVLSAVWDAGIRYFDTAPHYGHGMSERRLGDFLRQYDQDEYIISTKVGRILTPLDRPVAEMNGFVNPLPFKQTFDYSYDGIMRSVEGSFNRLGLNKLDILYVHDIGDVTHGDAAPAFFKQLTETGHRALSQLKAEGTVKAIGLGVNEVEVCEALMGHMEMDLILLAGRYTLLDQSAAANLLGLCAKNRVRLVIGGVFNSGILATGPKPGAHYDYELASQEILDQVTLIESICKRHDVPLAAAALAFPLRAQEVASVLIGTAKSSSLLRNLKLLDLTIPDALWQDLKVAGLMTSK